MEKKLDGIYTKMLRAILNKSWQHQPTEQQLYDHLPPITKTIQVRRTRLAGQGMKIGDEFISDILLWTPSHLRAKAGRPIYNSSVPIQDVVLKTSREQWTIETGGERGSGKSVLATWHDDELSTIFLFLINHFIN